MAPVVPRVTLAYSPDEVDRITKRIWIRRGEDFGAVLHALRSFEPTASPPEPGLPSLGELQTVLTDQRVSREWYGGRVTLLKTRHGLRYATDTHANDASQAHVDQCVSLLAGLGIAPDAPLVIPDGEARVGDLIADSMANFLPTSELEWSALAFGAYLPPRRGWTNRFGREFTFDDLARWLMVQPFGLASCGGTHALYSLAYLARVDADVPIFSRDVRGFLQRYLDGVAEGVAGSQQEDGSINPFWHVAVSERPWYAALMREIGPESAKERPAERLREIQSAWGDVLGASVRDRVLITGHQIEWLMLLPADRQPGPETFRRAGDYLLRALEGATDREIADSYCPYSHAARVARLLSGSGGAPPRPGLGSRNGDPQSDPSRVAVERGSLRTARVGSRRRISR